MLRFLEKRKYYLVYIPLISYWIILLAATSFPTTSVPTVDVSDKFMHFAAYLGLGILINLTLLFQNRFIPLKKKNILYTLLIGSFYAAIDEVHQHFIPGRYMELLDFVADLAGLALAVIFVLSLVRITKFIPNLK
ncbi:MAG: hypothetical protein EHM47_16135 [Ignavibacteriales bacterium]|nr:MAG: hypothetical protein EHM47_16135 [Ignavibacteriales bacterium]